MIDITRSNTGHVYADVDGSVAMCIMMGLFISMFLVLYLAYRVYA